MQFPIPPWTVSSIREVLGENRVELILKNGFRVVAYKFQFEDYEAYKNSVASVIPSRMETTRSRPKFDGNGNVFVQPQNTTENNLPVETENRGGQSVAGDSDENTSNIGAAQS